MLQKDRGGRYIRYASCDLFGRWSRLSVHSLFGASEDSNCVFCDGHNEDWTPYSEGDTSYALCRTVATYDHDECGIDYELIEDTSVCVKSSVLATTWMEAEASCVADGAHLVSIHSQQMNDYVRRLALSHNFLDGVFVGMQLRDRQTVEWSDHTNFDYDNFDPGMPNWMFGECGALQTRDLMGRWTSISCNSGDHLPYICMRPITCPTNNTLEEHGEFSSPDYPNSVVTGLECEYFLAANPGNVIALRFLDVSLQSGDSVTLYDGMSNETPLAVVTNADPGDRFLTKDSNIMRVIHRTSTIRGKRWWHASFLSI